MDIDRLVNLTAENFQKRGFFRISEEGDIMPDSRARSVDGMSVPFLQEANRLTAGQSCNFFEITDFSAEGGEVEVTADIMFVNPCDDIRLQAVLYNTAHPDTPLKKLDAQECRNQNFLSYHASAKMPEMKACGDELAVAVYAEWESASEPHGQSVLLESIGYDNVSYHHVHPVKCTPYMTFPQKNVQDYDYPEALERDDGIRDGSGDIVLALYRKPEDTKDLDYLCLYGWDAHRRPYLMVPGQGRVTFTEQDIEPDSVTAICYLDNLDQKGVYVAAKSGHEYENEKIKVNAGTRYIAYEMFEPWNQTFVECNGSVRHHFSYNIIITYKHRGDSRTPYSLHISNKPQKGKYIYQVPDISIFWGCLLGETQILMADGSRKMIKEVRIGDRVMSESGGAVEVKNTWRGEDECYYEIASADGKRVGSSESHPFLTENGWKKAGSLREGDRIKQYDLQTGEESFTSIVRTEKKTEPVTVYNLELCGNAMIANGFISGDFKVQNEM